MANFEHALDRVLKNEGGYCKLEGDTGGETYKGVSRNNFPDWIGWDMIDAAKHGDFPACLDKSPQLAELIQDLYRTQFWNAVLGDDIANQGLAFTLFDMAVNSGVSRAVEGFQCAFNMTFIDRLKVDGVLGPKTIAALKGCDDDDAAHVDSLLTAIRAGFYLGLCAAVPAKRVFKEGWLNRVYDKVDNP